MVTNIHEPSRDTDIDLIWSDDLLFRKSEADRLIAYIQSVAARPHLREDKRAFTIAVDAQYGGGKSFFLKRLSKQLSLEHPVAFVDAWSEDLANEPLTALAATLEEALEPFLEKSAVRNRYDDFVRKTGKVAAIVGKGLVRRGIGIAIGAGAVEGAEAVLSGASDDLTENLENLGEGFAEDASEAVRSLESNDLMKRRIAEFREGQAAVRSMRASLSALVNSLSNTNRKPPIVIMIDELDRCKPTYAIKLLEEIKHLFDVSGLVFILAMHAQQLGYSVSGAYGPSFDGRGYLKRFVDREYRLRSPRLDQLLNKLLAGKQLERHFRWPQIVIPEVAESTLDLSELISEYMNIFGLGPRDAFELIDILETSIALAGGQHLHAPYFIPLAIGHMKNIKRGGLPEAVRESKFAYLPNWSRANSSDYTTISFPELALMIQSEIGKPWQYYHEQNEKGLRSYALQIGSNDSSVNQNGIQDWSPSGYPRLLETVGRFENPKL